jgi:hypothetical protein
MEARESIARTTATSGGAVVFAGTVWVSRSGHLDGGGRIR